MDIEFFAPRYLETVVDLFHDMSIHYNGQNASNKVVVRKNLIENILGQDSGVRLVLALEHAKAVGLASISLLYPAPKERGQLFMKELYVLSGYRSRGIGKKLMQFVASYAISKGCSRFDLTVDETNPDAIAFYETLGALHVKDKRYYRLSGEQLEDFARSDIDKRSNQ
jgi:ribosomal protein S18 acetylase RimI-like enzyme